MHEMAKAVSPVVQRSLVTELDVMHAARMQSADFPFNLGEKPAKPCDMVSMANLSRAGRRKKGHDAKPGLGVGTLLARAWHSTCQHGCL